MMSATCRTPGCGNAGITIPLDWIAADDPTPDVVICGACGNPITDTAVIDPAELLPPAGESQDPAADD